MVELLIVIGILLIIFLAAIPVYGNFQALAQLNNTTSQMVQNIRTAKGLAGVRYNNSRHGVKFFNNSYTVYQGATYAGRDTDYDRVFDLDDVFNLTTTLASDEVNFRRGSGLPDNTGTITLVHDVEGTKQITINEWGLIEE